MAAVVPRGCTWVDDAAVAVDPDQHTVTTRGGRELGYDHVVLCPGLEEDWEAVTGDTLRRYDGYTVMPITTDRKRVLLVEVDRHGRRMPTVPGIDLVRPRFSTWWVDRYALPQVYWRRILRGRG